MNQTRGHLPFLRTQIMRALTGRVAIGGIAVCATLVIVSCGGKDKKNVAKPGGGDGMTGSPGSLTIPKVDESLCDTSSKRVTTFDLNRDNKPDVWKLYATVSEGGTTVEVLTCKQVDYDHDGIKDYVVTYRETGELRTEEADLTFDGRFDARHHFDEKTGKIYLIERDMDHDKKPDVWEKFDSAGRIESVRRDSNADGKPDIWEQYTDGQLVAILYDDDYDNKVDRKEQLVETKPIADAPPAPNIDKAPKPEIAPPTAPQTETQTDDGDGTSPGGDS